MSSTTYAVRSKQIDGRRVYYVIDERNPHVSQHSGYYATRTEARQAMNKLAWGEAAPAGTC